MFGASVTSDERQRVPQTPAAPDSQTIVAREHYFEPWRDPEWQRLWLSVQRRTWSSLALVPAGEGAPVNFTVLVAVILSRTGMVHLGSPIQVADATQIPLPQLTQFLDEVSRFARNGERIVVALPPAAKSPVTVSIAQATDAALLCVMLDRMSSSAAKKTVAQIGASRFVGSAIFHADQLPSQ